MARVEGKGDNESCISALYLVFVTPDKDLIEICVCCQIELAIANKLQDAN